MHSPRPDPVPKAQFGSGDSCQSSQDTTMPSRNKDFCNKTKSPVGTGMPTHAAVGKQLKSTNRSLMTTPAKKTRTLANEMPSHVFSLNANSCSPTDSATAVRHFPASKRPAVCHKTMHASCKTQRL